MTLGFAEGGLETSAFEASYLVTTNTTLAVIKPENPLDLPTFYPLTVKATLAPKTGLIKGTFIHPDLPPLAKPTLWYGAMLQDGNAGEGFFMGPLTGGKVSAEAKVLAAPMAE